MFDLNMVMRGVRYKIDLEWKKIIPAKPPLNQSHYFSIALVFFQSFVVAHLALIT